MSPTISEHRKWTVEPFTDSDLMSATALWNSCCGPGKLVYQPLSPEMFRTLLVDPIPGVSKINRVVRDGQRLIGYAGGTYRDQGEQGYVTIVLVDESYRRQGVGATLLRRLESDLRHLAGDRLNRFEIMFFNPVALNWIVPGTPGHDHPNSPGVDVACDGYLFLKNQGYRDIVYQNSYYQSLDHYQYPAEIQTRLQRLAGQGIHIAIFDPVVHDGMEALLDDLGSDDWRQIVMANIAPDGPRHPVIIVEHDNKVCGFTGPISVQPSGRGYFAGIGIHSGYRGRGAGKVLFSALCLNLKAIGASFMTLFTGETNPARNIYEAAGFKIVRTWADMKKEVKSNEP